METEGKRVTKKRERSKNYIEEEKENLLDVVEGFKHILENKKTDAVSCQQKTATWTKVANIYNSTAKTGPRTGLQLKLLYDNLKKNAKKHKAEEKVELYKTGGGNSSASQITDCDLRILNLLSPEIEGLSNVHDSNADFVKKCQERNTAVIQIIESAPGPSTQVTSEPPVVAQPVEVVEVVFQNELIEDAAISTSSYSKINNKKRSFRKMQTKKGNSYQEEILQMKKERHDKKLK